MEQRRETFKEYSVRIRKANTKKDFMIKDSLKTRKIAEHYVHECFQNKRPHVTKEVFDKIIHNVNTKLANELLEGRNLYIPFNLGKFYVVRLFYRLEYIRGKWMKCKKINWQETLRLWYDDNSLEEEKFTYSDEKKCFYRVRYMFKSTRLKNRKYMYFNASRKLIAKLNDRLEKRIIDSVNSH